MWFLISFGIAVWAMLNIVVCRRKLLGRYVCDPELEWIAAVAMVVGSHLVGYLLYLWVVWLYLHDYLSSTVGITCGGLTGAAAVILGYRVYVNRESADEY